MVGGVLAAISFLGALFLLISGKQDQWITLVLASAFIAIVVAQLIRPDHPNA
jgi:Mg/Co/Ni transporter MgtE